VKRIEKDYASVYKTMNWLSSAGSVETATKTRDELISAIFGRPGSPAAWEFAGTKPYTHGIRPDAPSAARGNGPAFLSIISAMPAVFTAPRSKTTGDCP